MQRYVITRHFSHVPVTLLRTECLYGAIRRSILSLYYILLAAFTRQRCQVKTKTLVFVWSCVYTKMMKTHR